MTVALLYTALSLLAFILYAIDKNAAREKRRRIAERTLHAVGLAGGWPGALLARRLLRHKTRKQPFRTVFWLTAAGNLALLGLIYFRITP